MDIKHFSEEERKQLMADMCDYIAEGGSMREWVALDDSRPTRRTIFKWIEGSEEFQKMYIVAHELQADYFADELLAIADDQTKDFKVSERSGREVKNHTAPARSQQQINVRKFLMERRAPKKWGVRVDVTSAGEKIDGSVSVVPMIAAKLDGLSVDDLLKIVGDSEPESGPDE